jgi:hypothetical protein
MLDVIQQLMKHKIVLNGWVAEFAIRLKHSNCITPTGDIVVNTNLTPINPVTRYLTCDTVTGCTSFQQYIENAISSISGNTYLTCETVTGCTSLQEYITNEIASFTGNTGSDIFVTGGTYNQNNGIATFTNNSGGTFNVNGFYTGNTSENGVHNPIMVSGGKYNQSIVCENMIGENAIINKLILAPYIPFKTHTVSSLSIECTTLLSGANSRILVYSDLNGIPDTKLIESPDLSCATTGIKSYSISHTFTKGVIYWIGVHSNKAQGLKTIPQDRVLPIQVSSGGNGFNSYELNVTFGSAPTIYTGTLATWYFPEVRFTII